MAMFFDPVKLISNSSFALKLIYVLNIKTTFGIITNAKVKQEIFFLKIDSPQLSLLLPGTANIPIKIVN